MTPAEVEVGIHICLTFLFISSLLVWWSSAHTYKNAITNELFLLTSAEAYLRTGNNTYHENAVKVRLSVPIVLECYLLM